MLGDGSVRTDSSTPTIANLHAEGVALSRVPITETGMLIRRPVGDVFEAIVNPEITRNFWFTKGSGRLEVGRRVQWAWEMYDVSIQVIAKAIEPNARIVIEWPGYSGPTTSNGSSRHRKTARHSSASPNLASAGAGTSSSSMLPTRRKASR